MMEVVVAGGGLAGVAVALALAERGAAVNLVEAERPGSAATGASAGMLAPQYESAGSGPLYDALVQARAWHPRFIDRIEALSGLPVDVRWDGMLVANANEAEAADAAHMLEWQHAHGQRGNLLDADEALRLQPGLAADVHSYLWLPDEGQVDTQQLALALEPALDAAGVRVISGRRVTAVRVSGTTVTGAELGDGRVLDADAVVVAAGAWSELVAGLPRVMGVRPVRGHIIRFPPGSASLGRLLASHAAHYLVPRNDGSIIAGSTMDETGFDRSMDDERLQVVHGAAAALLPALAAARPLEQWADLRPISADGLPVAGCDTDIRGLCYATGYGRNGILLAPLAAEIVAEALLHDEVPELWRAFSPARLSLR